MKKCSLLLASTAFVLPSAAYAQSSGTIAVEESEAPVMVVTGSRGPQGVEGIVTPDTARAQAALTQEQIQRQPAGQTILNTINLVPGVNFTNNDPYGSSGGNIRIRGFDGNRISLTFDGLPLNDTGNYAIFSNQQLDPELIEQVNVNLGQTDVDSPTASAAGGTVNYRTLIPRRDLGARVSASIGDFEFHRVFGMIETGELWDDGPRAFFSASRARNDLTRGPGEIDKHQYNGRIYYGLGGSDFISVAGHYNQNRNNFYRNPGLNDYRTLLGNPANVPTAANISFTNPAQVGGDLTAAQYAAIEGLVRDQFCVRPTAVAGTAQNEGGACGNYNQLFFNPSDTGNVRISSRFSLSDELTLTVDPSYQYVLANGGGTTTLAENSVRARGSGAGPGRDFNGDGDVLDTIRFLTPNNTNTNRYGLTASLIWNPSPQHRFRIAYTFDRGEHRQTGEWGFLDSIGNPESRFGGRQGSGGRPVLTQDGFQLQQRDRDSVALLNQISGQYVGRFFDDRLRVEIGVRAPFFERELQTFCPIEARSGFAYCTSEPIAARGTVLPGNSTSAIFVNQGDNLAAIPNSARPVYAPFAANYKFDAILPNVGLVYNFTDQLSVFGSYARGFSAPRTDNLYRAPAVDIDPETTDAFDLGIRYRSRFVQAQLTGWMINYKNRIITTFDPDQGISVDRNVGAVDSYGFDGSIAFQPFEELTLYALASYISAEFQENVQLGVTNAPTGGATLPAGTPIFAPTQGRTVAETPEWQFGGRAQLDLGPVELGVQVKFVDDRFATDVNDVVVNQYTTFDVDGRFSLEDWGLERTYIQANIINIFDEKYFGSIGSQINAGNICPAGGTCSANGANPNFTLGAPRTFLISLNVGY